MMRRMSGLEEPPSGRPKLSPLPSDPPPISALSSTNGPGLKVSLSLLLQSDILSVRISQAPSSEAKIWCQLFLLNVANEDSDSSLKGEEDLNLSQHLFWPVQREARKKNGLRVVSQLDCN